MGSFWPYSRASTPPRDKNMPPPAKRQRTAPQDAAARATKPSLQDFRANRGGTPQNLTPGFGVTPPQTPAQGFGTNHPPHQAAAFPPNPYARDAGPWGIPQSAANPPTPNLPAPKASGEEYQPFPRAGLNYSQIKAKQLGVPKYKPEVHPGSSFPPELLKTLCGSEGTADTPLQQRIKSDIESGVTQGLDVKTMLNYANMQHNADKKEAEKKSNNPENKRARNVAKVDERRDPKAPNGCIYRTCNMPRGVHAKQCTGEGRDGTQCTEAEHAAGNCNEREGNRRQKMKAVGLDPDLREGPSSTYQDPSNSYEAPDYFADVMGSENHFADAMDAMGAGNTYADPMGGRDTHYAYTAGDDDDEWMSLMQE